MKRNVLANWPGLALGGVALGLLALAAGNAASLNPFRQATAEPAVAGGVAHENLNPSILPGDRSMSVASTTGKVIHANEDSFDAMVLQSSEPVLVDFYADWCGPCRRIAPVLDELAAESPGAKIVKVNVDDSPGLAARYGVASIPNLQVFRGGSVRGQVVGMASKEELRALLRR